MRRISLPLALCAFVAAYCAATLAYGVAWVERPVYGGFSTGSMTLAGGASIPALKPSWWAIPEIGLTAPSGNLQWGWSEESTSAANGTASSDPFGSSTVSFNSTWTPDASVGGVFVFQGVGVFLTTGPVDQTVTETGSPVAEAAQYPPSLSRGYTSGGTASALFVPVANDVYTGRLNDYGPPAGYRSGDTNAGTNVVPEVDYVDELLCDWKTTVVVGLRPIPNSTNYAYRVIWADRVRYGHLDGVHDVGRGEYEGTIAKSSVASLMAGGAFNSKARVVKWSTDRWVWATSEQLTRVRDYRVSAAGRSVITTDADVIAEVMGSLTASDVVGVASIETVLEDPGTSGSEETSSTGILPPELPDIPGVPDWVKSWLEGVMADLDNMAAKFQDWLWPIYLVSGVF